MAKPVSLPEITDQRPRTIKYECDMTEQNGGEGLNVTEDVAIKFADAVFTIELYETNRETLEETLVDRISLDISSMLFPTEKVEFRAYFDKLQSQFISYLKLDISCDKPMLSDFYRRKLNPLQINLVSIKDIPYKTEPNFKPIYASLHFVDGKQRFNTAAFPQ